MSDTDGRQRITRELLLAAFNGPPSDADDSSTRDRVIASIEERDCEVGDTLFKEGDEAKHLHFIPDGRVRLTRMGRADWVFGGRWVLGGADVLAARPRSRTATIEVATRTFSLPADYWFSVMRNRPAGVINALEGYYRSTTEYHALLAPDGGFLPMVQCSPFDGSTIAGRLRALSAVPMFAEVPAQMLLELAAVSEERSLGPGEAAFSAGTPHAELAVITRGEVELTRTSPDVRAIFGPGSAIGGAVCFVDRAAAWTARALGEVNLITVPSDTLLDSLEDHVEAMRAMMKHTALEQERLCEEIASRRGELVLG